MEFLLFCIVLFVNNLLISRYFSSMLLSENQTEDHGFNLNSFQHCSSLFAGLWDVGQLFYFIQETGSWPPYFVN